MYVVPYSPWELNAVYGINCYANAVEKPTVRYFMDSISDIPTIYYLLTTPGTPEIARTQAQVRIEKNFEEFVNAVQTGCCAQDGLKALGTELIQEPGTRIAAMFFNEKEVDYHFAVLEDPVKNQKPQWRSKIPREAYKKFHSPSDIAAETGYKLHSYYVVPEKFVPNCFSDLKFRERKFETDSGHVVAMNEVKSPKQIHQPFASTFMLSPTAGLAFSMAEERFYQMPPLPSHPNPVLAKKTISTLNKVAKEMEAAPEYKVPVEGVSPVTMWASALIYLANEKILPPHVVLKEANDLRVRVKNLYQTNFLENCL